MSKAKNNGILKIALLGELLIDAMQDRADMMKKEGYKPNENFFNLLKELEEMNRATYRNREIYSSSEFLEMQNKIDTVIRKNTIVK